MKKRLLTAWIIACMFICLVGQTPITALAEGDDTRVISVPEGLQEVLNYDMPETQTVETEDTTEETNEVQTETEDENGEVQGEDENVQGESGTVETPENQTVEEDVTSENPDVQAPEDATEETPENQTQDDAAVETPDVQTPEDAAVETPETQTVQEDDSDVQTQDETTAEIPEVQTVQDETVINETSTNQTVQEETAVEETPENIKDVQQITETNLTASIVASDGNTYETNVTYTSESGIPMEGVALKVTELVAEDEGYDEYLEESASKVGVNTEDILFSKVFDIKIVDENDENIEYEPTGNVDVSIRVVGVSLDEFANVNVLHFVEDKNEENYLVYDVETTVSEETVEFSTDSFSVYVVIGHEGEEVENPRVEFHFITNDAEQGTIGSEVFYKGIPYPFKNKGVEDNTTTPITNYTQYTQILKNGESLELIEDPQNEGFKYFFGWYVVDPKVISGTTNEYGIGTDGKLYYTWPANPNRISFESPITINDTNVNIGIDTVSWEMNGVSGSGTVDEDGNVHVFLAPVFENYHFVNFMLRPYGTSSNNLMTRKMVALGSASSTEVKISDVRASSTDPVHLVFTGWGYYDDTINDIVSKPIIDYSGAPVTDPGRDGVYMSVELTDQSINLYPIFIEARWVDFFAGNSGSGAKYVPSRFLEAWGRALDPSDPRNTPEHEKNVFTSLPVTTRSGYNFDGWYTFANVDSVTGEITNRYNEEPVDISYITFDSNGNIVTTTVTVNTKAVQISDGTGNIINSGTWSYNTTTGKLENNDSGIKLIETSNGELRFFDGLDRMKLSANWASNESRITVIYWTENVQDENYSAPADPKADYTASAVKVITTQELRTALGGSYASGSNLTLGELQNYEENSVKILDRTYLDDVGAVLSGEEKFYDLNTSLSDASVTIKGDGSSVFNVYFERKTFKLVFHIGRDGYVKQNGQQREAYMNPTNYPQFADWDGNWIQFMFYDSKTSSAPPAGLGYAKGPTAQSYHVNNQNFSMTYTDPDTGETKTATSAYITNATNVLGDYVPADDENLYVITAKYGAYIADRWPTPTNPNFVFTDPDGSTKTMYTWAAYYGSRYCYIAHHRSTYGNNNGNNPDVNGVYEYMSAELCTNRDGTDIINDSQVHHLVAYFGDKGKEGIVKTYHIMYKAIDGTYDSNSVTTEPGSNYLSYSQTTWSQANGNSSRLDGDFYEKTVSQAISNVEPQFQMGWEYDGYEYFYSCYNTPNPNDHHVYFFYEPKQYTLTFDIGTTTETDQYYYKQTLSNANKYTDEVIIPEGYYFNGWYTNAEGVGTPFDFSNETMPSHNVVLYPSVKALNYVVKIDPNGGVIDHRANTSVSTYFNTNYGTQVGEYNVERRFIKLSEREQTPGDTEYYDQTKYYYINTQLLGIPSEGDWGLPTELRNAIYVSENDIDAYYNWYCDIIDNLDTSYWTGISKISTKEAFTNTYADYPYRPVESGENYSFMGWYQVYDDGSVAAMPYNFNDPVKGNLKLRALWRLDDGYYIQYNPYFFAEEGNTITAVVGEIANRLSWTDPEDTSSELYADQSATQVLRAPTNITPGWVFRGWRVVRQNGERDYTDTDGQTHRYPYWESYKDTTFYQPGDSFTVDAELVSEISVAGKIIHMQAYYEREDTSYRRPKVTNLVLDSNISEGGYYNTIDSTALPPLNGSGSQLLNPDSSTWDNNDRTQVLLGDFQSNLAVHLEGYNPFLSNRNNYLLIGFDENADPESPTTGKAYIPAFAGDSVISVQRSENHTLYAMWEPMVYVTFVNDTDAPIKITLDGTAGAVSIVNKATGRFNREEATTTIDVPANDSVKVVLPKGDGKAVTATVTNDHPSKKMSVSGEFPRGTDYGTGSSDIAYGNDVIYTGTLQTDADGIFVTYTEYVDAQVLYNVNGGTWNPDPIVAPFKHSLGDEYYAEATDIRDNNGLYEPDDPTPPSGKIFIGWTDNAEIAAHTDFSSTAAVNWNGTTITPDEGGNVLEKIKSSYLWDFSRDASDLYNYNKTLYAVWSDTVTVTYNIAYSSNMNSNPLKNHTWGGPATTDTAGAYVYYRNNANSPYVTYTVAKGDYVPKPDDPTVNSDKPTWFFIKWLENNNTTNSYRYSAKTPKDGNLTTYAFDFSKRITSDVTLVTSWTENEPQIFEFTVRNELNGVSSDAEFDYTIAVSDEKLLGKMGQTKPSKNLIGVPDQTWGSVTTKLKNNQEYRVIVKVMFVQESWGGNNSVEITVIDRDGNVIKDGQVFYCNFNTNKNFASDYKYTLTITQNTAVSNTIVSTDYNTGTSTDDVNRTFTFNSCEWRTSGGAPIQGENINVNVSIHDTFSPEVNNYADGDTILAGNNSIEVVFTNYIAPAPTDYSFNYKPFFMMFGFGAILLGLIVPPALVFRRRKEEEE
ncbi:MAG: InlB B-repeat-containing protein [Lachnospiraceae bacterium]|nr:InlB B-repeat-containing protein [Lachnospiraceae bacterium]